MAAARFFRRTGAYVSGIVSEPTIQSAPVKIAIYTISGSADLFWDDAWVARHISRGFFYSCGSSRNSYEASRGRARETYQAFNPAPALCFTQKSTYNRSQGRTHERCGSENCYCQSTLGCGEHVGDDTAGIGQGGGAKSAGEESEDDKSLYILSASSASVEGGENAVGGEEEDLAAI